MENLQTNSVRTSERKLQKYYRFHAQIYDITRWCFLFGREDIVKMIPELPAQPRILEIGCGTGKNIKQLKTRFQESHILGIDLSEEMLKIAKNKIGESAGIKLRKSHYGYESTNQEPFDLILLSYSLTMMDREPEEILFQIKKDLHPNGIVAVVDFHTSPFGWFRRWMNYNHVDFSGRLLPLLGQHFHPLKKGINKAYGGWWSYFQFLGKLTS